MLGIFALAGIIGTPILAGKMLKNDIQHGIIDDIVKPTPYYNKNNKIIEDNFFKICRRCHMTMNKQRELLDERECNVGVEYLKYQGFDDEQIELFKKLFNENIKDGQHRRKLDTENKHQKYLTMINNQTGGIYQTKVYRKRYYGNEKIEYRLNQIMKDELWQKIVTQKPQYIAGNNGAKYIEIYKITAPKKIISDLDNIYKEVCQLQGLESGRW